MRICLLGDISGNLDEGMKNTTYNLHRELSKSNEVLLVRPRDLSRLTKWKEIAAFEPHMVHYIHGPTIKSFALTKILSFLCPRTSIAMSTTRPKLSRLDLRIAKFLRPDVLLIQSSDQSVHFDSMGFRTAFFPGGVDTEKFKPLEGEKRELRQKFGLPADRFVVLHVGHITPVRSLEVLAEISMQKKYLVYIVAATSWIKPHEAILSRLMDAGCIVNLGFIPKIEQVYQMADCYIFPGSSRTSAIEIPLSVLEAMACNLPVITGRFGGLPDMFSEGNGLHFADDTEQVLMYLNSILDGYSAKTRTREIVMDFSWDRLAMRLESIYEKLIEESKVYS